jgi:nitrogen-specific signal transduction histidine kinase
LVYEVVKKHSGLLDVKSRPGETEFTIRFPIRTGREADDGDEQIFVSTHPVERKSS